MQAVFSWRDYVIGRYPELDMLFHVANEGVRSKAQGAKLVAVGLTRGIPDIFLDVARGGFHGARFELKVPGGKVSSSQVRRIERYTDEGYFARVCWGAEEAIKSIEHYLRLGNGG